MKSFLDLQNPVLNNNRYNSEDYKLTVILLDARYIYHYTIIIIIVCVVGFNFDRTPQYHYLPQAIYMNWSD